MERALVPVCEDIKNLLELNRVYLLAKNLWIGKSPINPINAITLYDTTGSTPQTTLDGQPFYNESFQVMVRNVSYLEASKQAFDIVNLLHNQNSVAIGWSHYIKIRMLTPPTVITSGRTSVDSNKQVTIFTINFQTERIMAETYVPPLAEVYRQLVELQAQTAVVAGDVTDLQEQTGVIAGDISTLQEDTGELRIDVNEATESASKRVLRKSSNIYIVTAEGTPAENGAKLKALYATLAQEYTEANQFTYVLVGGHYHFDTSFVLIKQYVNFVSLTGERTVKFTTSSADLVILDLQINEGLMLVGIDFVDGVINTENSSPIRIYIKNIKLSTAVVNIPSDKGLFSLNSSHIIDSFIGDGAFPNPCNELTIFNSIFGDSCFTKGVDNSKVTMSTFGNGSLAFIEAGTEVRYCIGGEGCFGGEPDDPQDNFGKVIFCEKKTGKFSEAGSVSMCLNSDGTIADSVNRLREVVLLANGWNGNNRQTITGINGLTENSIIDVSPAATRVDNTAFGTSEVIPITVGVGQVEFECFQVPTTNIQVLIYIKKF